MQLFERLLGMKIKQITPVEAKTLLSSKPVPFLLDVRQPEEYREARIRGATLLPLNQLPQRIKEVPKNREIVCVCQSGNRSARATRTLQQAGYRVANIQGGLNAWQRAGFPLQTRARR